MQALRVVTARVLFVLSGPFRTQTVLHESLAIQSLQCRKAVFATQMHARCVLARYCVSRLDKNISPVAHALKNEEGIVFVGRTFCQPHYCILIMHSPSVVNGNV